MDRKKHYRNPKIQEDLYQYEMGIELGAEIEWDKQHHLGEYQREQTKQDYKGSNALFHGISSFLRNICRPIMARRPWNVNTAPRIYFGVGWVGRRRTAGG